ncbi:MAG: sensor histidine kinase [Firmicutes bacterium]|nr:sensor histidine kinase [Bacillota bacterium]
MKNISLLLPVVLMFVILAILLFFMCLPLGQTPARAINGILNLSAGKLEQSIWQLTGQWQYVPDRLLTPEEFPADAQNMTLPAGWNDPLNGCATYRLTVYTDDTRQLNIFVPEIYTAYKLYLNGEFLRGAGTVSCDPTAGVPQFTASLDPVKAVDGKLEILIQASNYHFMRPPMNNLLLLGEHNNMNQWLFRTRSLYTFALGFVLAAAFYHLALYVLRRKEKIYLLFSLLCLTIFLRFALDTNGVSDFTGWFSFGMGVFDMRFFTVLFFLHAVLIGTFSLYVFEREWTIKCGRWFIGYAVAGILIFSLIPLNNARAAFVVFITMLPFMLFCIYRVARSRVLRENRMMWLYFTAMILYTVVGAVSKTFFDHLLFMTGLLTNMYLLMAQSLILARQYVDLMKAEQKLAVQNALLEETAKMREEMVRTFSHEIRTPLTVMASYTELAVEQLQRGSINGQTIRGLAVITDEAVRLGQLAGHMLERFKATGKAQEPQDARPINITLIASQLVRLLEPTAAQAGRKISLNLNKNLTALGKEDEITQVIWNLLNNALKHGKRGDIEVAGNDSDEFVCITVTDTGAGIPAELLPFVLERGVSGDGKSGLGLAIADEIVKKYGGRIQVESEYGFGTSVTMLLPAYKEGDGAGGE